MFTMENEVFLHLERNVQHLVCRQQYHQQSKAINMQNLRLQLKTTRPEQEFHKISQFVSKSDTWKSLVKRMPKEFTFFHLNLSFPIILLVRQHIE